MITETPDETLTRLRENLEMARAMEHPRDRLQATNRVVYGASVYISFKADLTDDQAAALRALQRLAQTECEALLPVVGALDRVEQRKKAA